VLVKKKYRCQLRIRTGHFFSLQACQACRLTGVPDIDFILNIFTDKQLKKVYSILSGTAEAFFTSLSKIVKRNKGANEQ